MITKPIIIIFVTFTNHSSNFKNSEVTHIIGNLPYAGSHTQYFMLLSLIIKWALEQEAAGQSRRLWLGSQKNVGPDPRPATS